MLKAYGYLPTSKTHIEFQAPSLDLAQLLATGLWGSKSADGRISLHLSLSPSPFIYNPDLEERKDGGEEDREGGIERWREGRREGKSREKEKAAFTKRSRRRKDRQETERKKTKEGRQAGRHQYKNSDF